MIRKTDYVAVSAARLTSMFANLPVTSGLVRGFAKSAQRFEDAAWQAFDATQLATTTGKTAELLGALVGETRAGRSDAELIAAIKVRILTNRSRGLASDLQALILAISPGATYDEPGNATVAINLGYQTSAISRALIAAMKRAKPAGVLVQVFMSPKPLNAVFAPGSVTGSFGKGPSNGATGLPYYALTSVSEV